MKKLGPYSRPPALASIDMRSKEGRLLRKVRAELTAHVGSPSATQRIIIERCAVLQLQLAMLDAKHAAGNFTPYDQREYLAWTGAFTRLLRQLGLKGAAERAPNLREYIAAKASAAA